MKKNRFTLGRTMLVLGGVMLWSVSTAWALPAVTGSTGGVSFGVAPYGGAPPGVPTYIANNFTLRNDILSSPGGTFLTANPVVANNIASSGIQNLPWYQFQIGGGNFNGPFGVGEVLVTPTNVGFSLVDANPAGGQASYAIASAITTFNNPVAYVGPFGTFLAVAGELPVAGTAGVAAIRTYITSANPASPFFNGGLGIELPQLVLANSRQLGNLYSFVATGGTGSAMVVDNAVTGHFRGLAINNLNFAIPAGDVFTAYSTLTVYADPMAIDMIDAFDPLNSDLLALAGGGLPSSSVFGSIPVPEPSSMMLACLGVSFAILTRRRRP